MKLSSFGIAACISLGVVTASQAAQVTIDFEDVSFGGVSTPSGTQVSRGFRFEATATNDSVRVQSGDGTCSGGCVDNGTQALHIFNADQTAPFEVLMSSVNGQAFSLLSFDFTERFKFTANPAAEIELVGALLGGGNVVYTAFFDDIADTFQEEQVSGLSNVTSVLFKSTTYFPIYDNIVVAPVPLPAGGVLLLSGLAGIAALKHRAKRAA